jgi:hypothetical protein
MAKANERKTFLCFFLCNLLYQNGNAFCHKLNLQVIIFHGSVALCLMVRRGGPNDSSCSIKSSVNQFVDYY